MENLNAYLCAQALLFVGRYVTALALFLVLFHVRARSANLSDHTVKISCLPGGELQIVPRIVADWLSANGDSRSYREPHGAADRSVPNCLSFNSGWLHLALGAAAAVVIQSKSLFQARL